VPRSGIGHPTARRLTQGAGRQSSSSTANPGDAVPAPWVKPKPVKPTVTDPDHARPRITHRARTARPIDASLFNNAGGGKPGPASGLPTRSGSPAFALISTSPRRLSRACVPAMLDSVAGSREVGGVGGGGGGGGGCPRRKRLRRLPGSQPGVYGAAAQLARWPCRRRVPPVQPAGNPLRPSSSLAHPPPRCTTGRESSVTRPPSCGHRQGCRDHPHGDGDPPLLTHKMGHARRIAQVLRLPRSPCRAVHRRRVTCRRRRPAPV